jgi:hypothetical protein
MSGYPTLGAPGRGVTPSLTGPPLNALDPKSWDTKSRVSIPSELLGARHNFTVTSPSQIPPICLSQLPLGKGLIIKEVKYRVGICNVCGIPTSATGCFTQLRRPAMRAYITHKFHHWLLGLGWHRPRLLQACPF